ncbi:uncharacterized protein LOC142421859 [Mycteria americana]|uniref:uncharacterized protein LOC142421859 n=1 Tax=Mycteria americana TaxID=33587 RepID=UPI003F582C1D
MPTPRGSGRRRREDPRPGRARERGRRAGWQPPRGDRRLWRSLRAASGRSSAGGPGGGRPPRPARGLAAGAAVAAGWRPLDGGGVAASAVPPLGGARLLPGGEGEAGNPPLGLSAVVVPRPRVGAFTGLRNEPGRANDRPDKVPATLVCPYCQLRPNGHTESPQ